jgi:hypothetical protein
MKLNPVPMINKFWAATQKRIPFQYTPTLPAHHPHRAPQKKGGKKRKEKEGGNGPKFGPPSRGSDRTWVCISELYVHNK